MAGRRDTNRLRAYGKKRGEQSGHRMRERLRATHPGRWSVSRSQASRIPRCVRGTASRLPSQRIHAAPIESNATIRTICEPWPIHCVQNGALLPGRDRLRAKAPTLNQSTNKCGFRADGV